MTKKSENFSIVQMCPVRNVIARFGNKWGLLVIILLSENGSVRFNQLGKLIPDISPKVLSGTLHILEEDALVSRTVFPEVPVRVEYKLTPRGASLVPIINELTNWAKENMEPILRHRKKSQSL